MSSPARSCDELTSCGSPGEFLPSGGVRIGSAPATPSHSFAHRRSASAAASLLSCFGSHGRRSCSYSGEGVGSFAGLVSPRTGNNHCRLPTGNVCPSGKVSTGMITPSSPGSDVLRTGAGSYGYGSIVRGSMSIGRKPGEGNNKPKKMIVGFYVDLVEAGNEQYKGGNYSEALRLYDRALHISPDNARCRANKAATLMILGRLMESVRECEDAVRLEPTYIRPHQRLITLHLRLGQVENVRKHISFSGRQPDSEVLQKLHNVESHLIECAEARSVGDWTSVLSESNAAVSAGANSSPQLFACKAEAHVNLDELDEATSCLSDIPELGQYPLSCAKTKFFGILSEAYVFYVRAQVAHALGRFDAAFTAAEKAWKIHPQNSEVVKFLTKLNNMKRAHLREMEKETDE